LVAGLRAITGPTLHTQILINDNLFGVPIYVDRAYRAGRNAILAGDTGFLIDVHRYLRPPGVSFMAIQLVSPESLTSERRQEEMNFISTLLAT
jgi:hypothetical protein